MYYRHKYARQRLSRILAPGWGIEEVPNALLKEQPFEQISIKAALNDKESDIDKESDVPEWHLVNALIQ